ncbi:hypothetical protein TNCV_2820161 [Trichonephila clavipes]|nr:hypothetical protein TNCV_2820161 [Trichonephila clavipes]
MLGVFAANLLVVSERLGHSMGANKGMSRFLNSLPAADEGMHGSLNNVSGADVDRLYCCRLVGGIKWRILTGYTCRLHLLLQIDYFPDCPLF